MKILFKLNNLDRRIIFVIIGLCVLIPLLLPLDFDVVDDSYTKAAYDAIEELDPGSTVLLSFDYSPGTKPEIQPMAIAMLKQLFRGNHKVFLMALWPDGKFMSKDALKEVLKEYPDKVYGVDYVNLGYKPGGEIIINQLAKDNDLSVLFPADLTGLSINSIPIARDLNLKDSNLSILQRFDFVISLSAGSVGTKEWILFGTDPAGVDFTSGCTSIQVTGLLPYADNNQQMEGIVAGLVGAAYYEKLMDYRGMARKSLPAQTYAHLAIVLFIVLGNLFYFIEKKDES